MQLGKRNALLAIAVGGLIAGALDITQAIILFGKKVPLGRARTAVQVWTVEEGFGIGSEFRQTRCAARNFRGHEVLFRWFK